MLESWALCVLNQRSNPELYSDPQWILYLCHCVNLVSVEFWTLQKVCTLVRAHPLDPVLRAKQA